MGDQDLRQLPGMGDHDLRATSTIVGDKDLRQPMGDQDFRPIGVPPAVPDNRPFDPRFRNMPGADANRATVPNFDRPRVVDPRTAYEARNTSGPARIEDPRKASMSAAALVCIFCLFILKDFVANNITKVKFFCKSVENITN